MLNFTRQEQQVLLFLLAIALSGTGINFLAKKYAPVRSMICLDPQIIQLDLNMANKDELMAIPGIGEKLATRILEAKKLKIRFILLEELKSISGINENKFEKIKGYLTIR
ncbi:MAG: helix-hairpin-helix domain-containing protein [Candidatus Omnitrophica bacterium]|nr:helix-hairpin-helix domain-containing protein [Candidatus Omnitrophota bacterium]